MFDTELRKDLWMATLVRKFSKSQKVFSTVMIFGEENIITVENDIWRRK